ncbi:uncharacterized protein M421DRAFT_78112 [Didymella exigua CBS 183.55]|uniref:Potassium channel tetramerisation-type BTB domain-containing protein n=1 Tax=Didymella exigua CBS 183.55 TaxID=1150837 RepID=A0A6A5R4B1_9PLEO|nr:uncharacterized protein M421DRAFT_78112 [Didymella exigua CBS 183.55]KAF1922483.1 hypothetical protein M421DRAFT_78112 [Didymella exigua CBS 183.55]
MKRKSDAQRELEVLQHVVDVGSPAKRRAVSRTSSTTSQSPAHAGLADAQSSPIANGAQIGRVKSTSKGTGPQGIGIDISEQRRVVESSSSVDMLPAGRVFPIQIGSALFRLSGASLCSDAPSYFSHFFSEQLQSAAGRATDMKTLYIDRDPDTFRDIALHLQGYHIVPQNGEHFVKLFADAHFYSLPRLTKQLFKSDIFIDIGGTPFRIPRDSFSAPGNSPNYFSLGFAQWFSTPLEVFPGLDRSALLRPPSISPPSVPNRSGDVFGELMRMLQGYEVEIRSETHRANLLRDARYFHLKGLEQKLINCAMSWNADRGQNEILIRLEDIRQSGVGFLPDARNAAEHVEQSIAGGSVTYARPYTDDAGAINHLVLETSSTESASLALQPASLGAASAHVTVSFHGDALRRITSLLAIVAAKMGLLSTQALAPPRAAIPVRIDGNTSLSLDGKDVDLASNAVQRQPEVQWTVIRAHWRIRVEPTGTVDGYGDEHGGERLVAVLEAVKVDAFTNERRRNTARAFLTA